MAACLLSKEYIKDDTIYMVFRTWDVDRDGSLSLEDFTSFIESEYPGLLEKPFGKELIAEFEENSYANVRKAANQDALHQFLRIAQSLNIKLIYRKASAHHPIRPFLSALNEVLSSSSPIRH